MSGLRIVPADEFATPQSVAELLRGFQFRFSNEDQLQEGIAAALESSLPSSEVRREVILAEGVGRVDVMVDRIAVEVKVAGTTHDVVAQCRRYAGSSEVDGLVLVTNQVLHGAGSGLLEGKPAEVVSLIGSQL